MRYLIITALITALQIPQVEAGDKLTAQGAFLACLGEAESESQTGKIALMETLRNRGNIRGVYGIKAITAKKGAYYRGKRKISQATVTACQAAWVDSKHTNYASGAIGWGNADDLKIFKKSKWFKNCQVVKKIDNHYFYKCNQ
jgi:spore germination cell wall hydrolase CwlJ-like protein